MAVLSLLHAGAHPGLTAFFSLHYLGLFLPAAVILFSLTPKKGKKYIMIRAEDNVEVNGVPIKIL